MLTCEQLIPDILEIAYIEVPNLHNYPYLVVAIRASTAILAEEMPLHILFGGMS